MTTHKESTFGFELLYKICEEQICKKEDVLILLIHWYFLKNDFKCLGIGDSKIISPEERGSETLPSGWNQEMNYTLRYVKNGKLYILMGIKSEEDLLINLLRIEDHKVSNVQFPIASVQQLRGNLESLIPSYQTIINQLKNEIVLPVDSGNGQEVSTQTAEQTRSNLERRDQDNDPLRVGIPQRPAGSHLGNPGNIWPNPSIIGQEDLDPFGRGGGGMLFDPFGPRGQRPAFPGLGVPGRLPHGAVPPGARFDPFGPPDNDPPIPRGRIPDNDHMPPPGFDDMFM